MNDLIYGKNPLQKIVGMEVHDDKTYTYIAKGDKTELLKHDNEHYLLLSEYDTKKDPGMLSGNNHYKYFAKFKTKSELFRYKQECKRNNVDFWYCYNPVEAAMLKYGYTMYKGMKLDEVSTLSFDIETTGVTINDNSNVLLISNTFRSRSGVVTRRLFCYDEYASTKVFLEAWCEWVRSLDPDIMLGHNILGFDLPYLSRVASVCGAKLNLGRSNGKLQADKYTRRFRKDGSQFYDYLNYRVPGRELIDTFFLSIKYDIGRKYPSYGLKPIIEHEGLQKANRVFWDFNVDKKPWANPVHWKKFKQYAEHDADDALALFDLMAPQFFYYAQSIPKSFQEINNTATGSQVNSFMLRSYLQNGGSIPKASPKVDFEGAISIGNAGLYKNVFKVDVASLYPSIIRQFAICNLQKDPNGNFLKAVQYFTDQRLENKKLAKDTGDRHYKDLSDGQKIMINSFYGFLGAQSLNFNYPEGAAEVTKQGRNVLNKAIDWVNTNHECLVNADTDSVAYVPKSGTMQEHLKQLNDISPDGINWEDDGIFDSIIVVKVKNYAMKQGDKVTIKGSGLKASMKEPALRNFIDLSIQGLLNGETEEYIEFLYTRLVDDITFGLRDIKDWCSKKTITTAVLNPGRTNEKRVLDSIQGENVQEGDKIHVFFKTPIELCLDKHYNGTYDKDKLYEKLYKTVKILEPVLNMSTFPNFKLKRNKGLLEENSEISARTTITG
jgi:DNA polymerase elongation subunit (family B)